MYFLRFWNWIVFQEVLSKSHSLTLYYKIIIFIKSSTLDELSLSLVDWKNDENAMKFFKTQTNLKKITLNEEYLYIIKYREIIIHIFGNNLQLKTVVIKTYDGFESNIEDLSFLEGIINPSVENLEIGFDFTPNADEFVSAFTKLFPNVKNFTYRKYYDDDDDKEFIEIHNWKSLETINCRISNINQFFGNIHLIEKLTTCTNHI